MLASTYSSEKPKEITLDDIEKVVKLIKSLPRPIDQIRVGKKLAEDLKKLFKDNPSVFRSYHGIQMIIDSTLKPNQYRIVRTEE